MAAEIAQEPARGAGLERMGIVEVHARVHAPKPAETAPVENLAQRENVRVPAPIVEDA